MAIPGNETAQDRTRAAESEKQREEDNQPLSMFIDGKINDYRRNIQRLQEFKDKISNGGMIGLTPKEMRELFHGYGFYL